jgi:hypothetical protein
MAATTAWTNPVVARIVEASLDGCVGAVGNPVKAGLDRGAAPKFVRAPAALFAPVPPLLMATGKNPSTYCFGTAPSTSVGFPDNRRRPVIVPPVIGRMPRLTWAAGTALAPVPPLTIGNGSVIPTAFCNAVISFLATRKLFRTEAVVGLPNTGTVASIAETILNPPRATSLGL